MAAFKDRATPLIEQGLSVIPVQPRAKAPLVGATGRSNDPKVIDVWDSAYPDANVGIVSDDIYTILETDDLDALELELDDAEGREIPATRALGSGRPGRRAFIFKRTAACGDACLEVPGVFEFRNRNQYVVGPGSIHPEGLVYKWLNDNAILEMPDWLVLVLKKLDAKAKGKGSGAHVSTGPASKLKAAYLKKLDPQDLIDSGVKIGANERHHTLTTVAGLLHDGERTAEDIAKILFAVRDACCENPGDKSDAEVYRLADYVVKRDPFQPTPRISVGTKDYAVSFALPRVPRKPREYVLNPKFKYDGWFMRGLVHLVSGQSGSGKTTLMLDLLDKQTRGEDFLGHKTNKFSYLAIMADRGELANEETCDRMGIDPDTVPVEFLSVCTDDVAVQRIIEMIEKRGVPQVVFIEGADGLVEEPNKSAIVAPFMSALGQVAKHYHIAIILSVGAQKQKKDGYALTRDKVFGSQMWPRMSCTLIFMAAPDDGTGDERAMTAQHRNAGTERFNLTFTDGSGRLVLAPMAPKAVDPFDSWIEDQPGSFTVDDAVKAGVLKKSAAYVRVKKMLEAKILVKDGGKYKFVNPE